MSTTSSICQTPLCFTNVVFSPLHRPCKQCGIETSRVWNVQRTAIDLELEQPGLLNVQVGVYHCEHCQLYFRACPPFLRPKATYTNRVVSTVIASILEDGMAVRRVSRRMARDYWIRPSEAIIRQWCRSYVDSLDLEQSYTPWIVSSFSGVLCVDELYQDNLAILLAVDPEDDRLVGYLLVHSSVNSGDVEKFLARLKDQGIDPEQIVTDGSALYPEVISVVWPDAAHQMCLFHQTRMVTTPARLVLRQIQKSIPKPPRQGGTKPGRLPLTSKADSQKRAKRIAIVRALRERGMGIREIGRHTGHSVVTVRQWLRGTVRIPKELPEVSEEELLFPQREKLEATKPQDEVELKPPEPWESWEQVQQVRQEFKEIGDKIIARPSSLSDEEQEKVDKLLSGPLHGELSPVYQFMQRWYRIWWDEEDNRQTKEVAKERFEKWLTLDVVKYPTLSKLQDKWDEKTFERLSYFLENEHWESTSNAAERKVRKFRQLQSPHFNWRTDEMVEGVLKADAIAHMHRLTNTKREQAVYSKRGRPPKEPSVVRMLRA